MTDSGSLPNDDANAALLRAMLDGSTDDPGDVAAFEALEQVVSSLRAPAAESELRGEAAAVAAFAHSMSNRRVGAARWRRRIGAPAALFAGKFALGAGVAVAATSVAAAAAAYTGSLPSPLQRFAHAVIGAPKPHHASPGSTPSPSTSEQSRSTVGATGTNTPAAIPAQVPGLCEAYRATTNSPSRSAVADQLRLLVGASTDLGAYCAQVSGKAGSTPRSQIIPSVRPNPTAGANGRQGTPGGAGNASASAHPSSHGNPHDGTSSGQPSTHNTPRPSKGAPSHTGPAAPVTPSPGRPSTPSSSSGHNTGRP